MKKLVSLLLVGVMMATLLVACAPASTPVAEPTKAPDASADNTPGSDAEIVDGRFVETRKITVEIYDRGNDGGSTPEDNFYTDYVKEGMLRDHNVEVTYIPVPRWTEVEVLNNLLAAGDAPDVCVTYSYPTIQTYANMGGVLDMSSYLEENKAMLSNLWGLLGDNNIYWNRDPEEGTIWAIEARLFNNAGQKTFIREDWLKKLNLSEPTNLEEFESMLHAFKDNAELLLGEDAEKIIPFMVTSDVGWSVKDLVESFVPNDMTDKEWYIYGFDDRFLTLPNYKEALRKVNQWYNEDLLWKDFALYPAGDPMGTNLAKAGYVGSYIQNVDSPYRDGDNGIQNSMKQLVGPDAAFITVPTFKNDAGVYKKLLSPPIDRKVFFPSTNEEPLASLLYLDWISKQENLTFLQIGEEGTTHEVMPDGAIKLLSATGEKIMNSPNNIDYTITCNGLHLATSELTVKSLAQGYAGIDSKYIVRAYDLSDYDIRYKKNTQVGEIKAEAGMATTLKEKRDNMLNQAVVAPVDEFDQIFDSGFQDYLNSGGKAIIDERTAAWEKFYE